MTNDSLIKRVFSSYLFIGILSTLTATAGMLVDGIVIGQVLGAQCVSAFGFAGPIVLLTAAVAGIFSNGGSAAASIHLGSGDERAVRLNFTVACAGTLLCSVLFTIVLLVFDAEIAGLLGADGEIIPLTADYIRGVALGMIPTMMTQVIMIYIRLNDGAKTSFLSVVCMTVCNIALDLYFAKVLRLGMFGMGLATSISYFVAMIVCCSHFFRKTNIFRFTLPKNGLHELVHVIIMGVPSALNRLCMTIRGIALNRLLLTLGGAMAVSALAVQNNVNQVLSSITMGVGMTVTMLAGLFFGERDEKMLEKALRVAMKTGITLSVAASAAIIIFARPVVGLFLEGNVEGMQIAVRSLRFFCLSLPLSLICVVLLNFYQCTKNLLMANIICITHGMAFVLLTAFALSPFLKTDAVWISFLCAEVLTILLLLVIIRIRTGRWPRTWLNITMLPADFRPSPENILDVSIAGNTEQVAELSARIHEFCSKHTQDHEKVSRLSLCIEELAGNIVLHGRKGRKALTIDIRIVVTNEGIAMRIRDDGPPFNPIQYKEDAQAAPGKTIGLRIVRGIAKEIQYTGAAGINSLTIRL